MKQLSNHLCRLAGSAILCTFTMGVGVAHALPADAVAEAGDPARWYQEDVTPQARFNNLKKEVDAAYKEAMTECKKLERSDRKQCEGDARNQSLQDMARAKTKTPGSAH